MNTCPHCGVSLPEGASFCHNCAQAVNARKELRLPWHISRRALYSTLIVILVLALAVGGWLYTRPKTYEGGAEIIYQDRDGKYQIVLGWMNDRYKPAAEVNQPVAMRDMLYSFPMCLYVNEVGTGVDKTAEFMRKVEGYQAEFSGQEDAQDPWFTADTGPRPDYLPDAALITIVKFTAYSSPEAELVWTLEMKNGDVIRGRQTMYCQPHPVYDYYPEDAPMDTIEELQALVDEINETIDDDYADINLYLPPVTYDGGLVIDGQAINLYGSSEGRTTFTDTVRICPEGNPVIYVEDIDFAGDRTSIGVSTNARVFLFGCGITGWKTGVLPYGEHTWVVVQDCLLEGNGTGFHFIGSGSNATSPMFTGNRFLNNGTALLLESIPDNDFSLDLSGCVFSGNETDIDNRYGQTLDISEAVFE